MGKALGFAMATTIIYTANITFTFFAAHIIGKRISELFNTIIEILPL